MNFLLLGARWQGHLLASQFAAVLTGLFPSLDGFEVQYEKE
jgi:hypothetical protein